MIYSSERSQPISVQVQMIDAIRCNEIYPETLNSDLILLNKNTN